MKDLEGRIHTRQRIEGWLLGAGERDWGLVFTGARAPVWGAETFLDWMAVVTERCELYTEKW